MKNTGHFGSAYPAVWTESRAGTTEFLYCDRGDIRPIQLDLLTYKARKMTDDDKTPSFCIVFILWYCISQLHRGGGGGDSVRDTYTM